MVCGSVALLAAPTLSLMVAVAHSILVICWHLLTNDCDYDDLGRDYFTAATPTVNATA